MAINIEMCYIHDNGKVFWRSLELPNLATIADALTASGWLELPELHEFKAWLNHTPLHQNPNHKAWFVGIFSQKKSLNTLLHEGDRLEIYRPLCLDPIKNRQRKTTLQTKQNSQNPSK